MEAKWGVKREKRMTDGRRRMTDQRPLLSTLRSKLLRRTGAGGYGGQADPSTLLRAGGKNQRAEGRQLKTETDNRQQKADRTGFLASYGRMLDLCHPR